MQASETPHHFSIRGAHVLRHSSFSVLESVVSIVVNSTVVAGYESQALLGRMDSKITRDNRM